MMKKFFVFTILVVGLMAAPYIPKIHATIVDPIVTTVAPDGLITVTHVSGNGQEETLIATYSISQAQAVWLDAVHKLKK